MDDGEPKSITTGIKELDTLLFGDEGGERDLTDAYPALRHELFTMAGMETV
jgi:hypothetical protein